MHQNRAILFGLRRRSFTAPQQNHEILEAPRCTISLRSKIASGQRVSLQLKWAKPDSHCRISCDSRVCAVNITSEWRCDFGAPPQFLKIRSKNTGANEILSCGCCSENSWFRIAQVMTCHSENGISHSEDHFLNSESCSKNTPELSQSSENGLLTPRAFFLELGWSPDF